MRDGNDGRIERRKEKKEERALVLSRPVFCDWATGRRDSFSVR
jgi:hypothetical protein